jgi:malate synthase
MELCLAGQPSFPATTEVYVMKGETKETWEYFCEQAAVEQDPDKLLELVKEINRMLAEKENRLLRARDQSAGQ